QQQTAEGEQDNRERFNRRQAKNAPTGAVRGQELLSDLNSLDNGRPPIVDGTSNSTFNREWLDQNKLGAKDGKEGKAWEELTKRRKKYAETDVQGKPAAEQPPAPALSTLEAEDKLEPSEDSGKKAKPASKSEGGQREA